jgi:hypothetical protein
MGASTFHLMFYICPSVYIYRLYLSSTPIVQGKKIYTVSWKKEDLKETVAFYKENGNASLSA